MRVSVQVPDPSGSLAGHRPGEARKTYLERTASREAILASISARVDQAFQETNQTWADVDTLLVDFRFKDSPWGFGSTYPDPASFTAPELGEGGRRLQALVSQAMAYAEDQVQRQFRVKYVQLVEAARRNAPDFGDDAMAEMSYCFRMHRLAGVEAGFGEIPFHDEIRLVFQS